MESEQGAIDRDVLDELEHSVGDDRSFLRELVETYLDDSPRQIGMIRLGIAAGDVESTNRAAHTLKSTSASLGALALSAMCRELQTMTSPETTEPTDLSEPDITSLVDAIAAEFERAASEIDALVPGSSSFD